jgi:hypothetical protein
VLRKCYREVFEGEVSKGKSRVSSSIGFRGAVGHQNGALERERFRKGSCGGKLNQRSKDGGHGGR